MQTPVPAANDAPDPTASPPYTLVHQHGAYVIAVYKNVSVIVWGTAATIPMVEYLEAFAETAAQVRSSVGSTIHIIVRGVALPKDEARTRLEAILERNAHRLACGVTVLEDEGFWASAMRGMVTGLHGIQVRHVKSHFCRTIEDAAAWLPAPHREMTSVAIEPAELLAVLRSIRARVGFLPE